MSLAIHYRGQGEAEQTFVTEKRGVVIGRWRERLDEVDLYLPDPKVSRPHARLYRVGGGWSVEDLGSKYGTLVNGVKVTQPAELAPGDRLQLGDTSLRVEFTPEGYEAPGVTVESLHVHETQPPQELTEDKLLDVLARVSTIGAHSQGVRAKLEGLMREIADAFPRAERRTLMLVEDGEIVPYVYWPPDRAYVSFTLANEAVRSKQALRWQEQQEGSDEPLAPSLLGTRAALYAPMLADGRVVGVIHLDSSVGATEFDKDDLKLLSVIANTAGPAVKTDDERGHIPSVFISYAHVDQVFADRLTSDLRRRGIKVYIDRRLRSGEDWRAQLALAIENTDALVFVISPECVASEYCAWELATALAAGRKVFPVMYRPAEAPEAIAALQYVTVGDYEKGVAELAERLHEFRNPPPPEPAGAQAARAARPAPTPQARPDEGRPASPAPRPAPAGHVLHLSDLHFGSEADAHNWHSQLVDDLLNELSCPRLDGIILSGDITNTASVEEFGAAATFISKLMEEFSLGPEQIVLVPGNHDLSWQAAKAAYKLHWSDELKGRKLADGTYIDGEEMIAVRDEGEYKTRFANFSAFFERVKGRPYPLDYERQYSIEYYPSLNLLVLGLNSAWELDHRYRARASIHPLAVTNALNKLRRAPDYAGAVRVAVWHHPLHSDAEDRIKSADFMERLAGSNFRLALHGHIHKAETGLYVYDHHSKGRRLDVVAAGTFGAPVKEWVPGYPLQYNLLKLSPDRLTVETRRREKLNGAWQPDARWLQGPGRDPLPRYEIEL